jgi:hypothetical protein
MSTGATPPEITATSTTTTSPTTTTVFKDIPFHISTHVMGLVLLTGSTFISSVISDPGVISWLNLPNHFFIRALVNAAVYSIPQIANYKQAK